MQNHLCYGRARNRNGEFVSASLESIAAAMSHSTKISRNFKVSIVDSPGAGVYPISPLTWIVVPAHIADDAKRSALTGFLRWMASPAQRQAAALDYLPLPKDVAAKERCRDREDSLTKDARLADINSKSTEMPVSAAVVRRGIASRAPMFIRATANLHIGRNWAICSCAYNDHGRDFPGKLPDNIAQKERGSAHAQSRKAEIIATPAPSSRAVGCSRASVGGRRGLRWPTYVACCGARRRQ